MKKVIVLILGLSLTAASCSLFGSGSGSRGIFKSEDAGQTFKLSSALEKKGDISGMNVNSFVADPGNPDVLYAGSSGGIYKTTNAAGNWKQILTGMRVGSIAINPNRTDEIYAAGIRGENGRIIRSDDGGSTWKDIYTEPTKNNAALSIAISKANSKVVVAGLNSGEIIRSVDQGQTWQFVKDIGNAVVYMEYTGNTTIYALTSSAGLYRSEDQGSNWTQLEANVQKPANPNVANNPYAVTVQPYSSGSSGKATYDVAFDRKLPGVIFLATDQGLLRTIDGGDNWSLMSLPVANETLKVSAAAINPNNSNNIYIAVGSTMFITTNGGVTWETKKLPTEQKVRHILINSQEPNIIYLGMGER